MTDISVHKSDRWVQAGRRLLPLIKLVALAALTILFILPIIWMVTTSLQSPEKMFNLETEWIPEALHFENYPNAFFGGGFSTYFTNSAIVSTMVMVSNVIFCTLAGYGLAKFQFPGDKLVLLLILSTMMLPIEVTIIPTFLVVHGLGWLNTYQGIAGPLLVEAFGIFLMRQSMLAIPKEYIEAARIDGAGEIRILLQIIVPQCLPALAVLAILSFRDSWDQFLWPLTIVSQDAMRTYPLALVQFAEDYGSPATEQLAIAVLASIPAIIIFFLLQRLLNKGFGLSGLK